MTSADPSVGAATQLVTTHFIGQHPQCRLKREGRWFYLECLATHSTTRPTTWQPLSATVALYRAGQKGVLAPEEAMQILLDEAAAEAIKGGSTVAGTRSENGRQSPMRENPEIHRRARLMAHSA